MGATRSQAPSPDADAEVQPAVEPAPWSLSLAYGQFTADLVFDEFVGLEVEQHMVVAGVSHAFEGGWRLGGTVGASLAGSLRGEDHRLTFRPGFVASFLAAVTFLEAEGYRPFFESTLTVSVSWATLRDEVGASSPWVALDFRLGATAGWRVHDVWVPYLAVRFFGGPVFWRDGSTDRVGTDRHHFQLAIGSTVTLWNVDLFVEWALPVGESGLSLGLGYRF